MAIHIFKLFLLFCNCLQGEHKKDLIQSNILAFCDFMPSKIDSECKFFYYFVSQIENRIEALFTAQFSIQFESFQQVLHALRSLLQCSNSKSIFRPHRLAKKNVVRLLKMQLFWHFAHAILLNAIVQSFWHKFALHLATCVVLYAQIKTRQNT